MKLDVSMAMYLTKEDFRVLMSVELGMKNHDLVPRELIASISGLKPSTAFRSIDTIHKHKLVFHSGQKYDGYRLTYMGYDYLALKALVNRGSISSVGRRIGVGKESDVYEVMNDAGEELILKMHRLGRISFRSIKNKRDYLGARKSANWLYMSRLAAVREYSYLEALHKRNFPVPMPIDQNRHAVLMSRASGSPLYSVREIAHPEKVGQVLLSLIVRLASYGLVHGDFNEFNLIIDDDETVTMIDFPQMISTAHENAQMQFDRDVECIRLFFEKRFHFQLECLPVLHVDTHKREALDVELSASGHSSAEMQNFDKYLMELKARENASSDSENEVENEVEECSNDEHLGLDKLSLHDASAVDKKQSDEQAPATQHEHDQHCEIIGEDAANSESGGEVQERSSVPRQKSSCRKSHRTVQDPTNIDLAEIRDRVKRTRQKIAAHRASKTARAARQRKVKQRHELRRSVQLV